MATEHENWMEWREYTGEADLAAAIARAETAEAVLAQCRDELDDLMAQRDTAEAALAERDTPCVFVWAESEQAWEAQCDGWLFPVYYAGDWPRCPRCGHPIKVQP